MICRKYLIKNKIYCKGNNHLLICKVYVFLSVNSLHFLNRTDVNYSGMALGK